MGDLDDGPERKPLKGIVVETAILDLLPVKHFDLIISHNPTGEYTRHLRHEEVGEAVINLWHSNHITANQSGRLLMRMVPRNIYQDLLKKQPFTLHLQNECGKENIKLLRNYMVLKGIAGKQKQHLKQKRFGDLLSPEMR